jgi:hypothetical protein
MCSLGVYALMNGSFLDKNAIQNNYSKNHMTKSLVAISLVDQG